MPPLKLIIPYLALALPWASSIILESLPVKIDENQGFYSQPMEQTMHFSEALHGIPVTFDRQNWLPTIKSNILNLESIVETLTDPRAVAEVRHLLQMDTQMMQELSQESDPVTRERLTEHLFNYYRGRAARSCEIGIMSLYNIAPAHLSERLEELEEKLREHDLELAFPHRQNISNYYNHYKLVQCVSDTADALVINLQIPVKRIHNHYSMEQFKLVPFIKNENEICVVDTEVLNPATDHMVTRNEKHRFLTTYNSETPGTRVTCGRSLCIMMGLHELGSDYLYPCLELMLLRAKGEDITGSLALSCSPEFSCRPAQADEVLLMGSIAPFTTFITSSRSDVNVSCHYQGNEVLQWTVKPPKTGAIQLVNPCNNCDVTVGSNTLQHSTDAGLCDTDMILKELQVFNVVPSAMEKLLEAEKADEIGFLKTEL